MTETKHLATPPLVVAVSLFIKIIWRLNAYHNLRLVQMRLRTCGSDWNWPLHLRHLHGTKCFTWPLYWTAGQGKRLHSIVKKFLALGDHNLPGIIWNATSSNGIPTLLYHSTSSSSSDSFVNWCSLHCGKTDQCRDWLECTKWFWIEHRCWNILFEIESNDPQIHTLGSLQEKLSNLVFVRFVRTLKKEE